MSYPTFTQPARRNLALPIALAVLLLAAVAGIALHFMSTRVADMTIHHVDTWQSHTVFKNDTILVGRNSTEDDLYVAPTLRIADALHIPIFVKDLHATVTTAEGETLTTTAIEQSDLPNLYQVFPAVKPLNSHPLFREITIQPGQSAEGTVLLRFPITQEAWSHRKSATLQVTLYHHGSFEIPIP